MFPTWPHPTYLPYFPRSSLVGCSYGFLSRRRSALRHHSYSRHDVLRREPVPPRSGRRQLRRARQREVGDGARDRREQNALPSDGRRSAPARADRREAARQESHSGRQPRGHPRESKGWRYDLDELESKITPRTRVLYLNSPHNPTGGVLTRADVERIAAIARDRRLWVISDEAYEDVVFEGEHVSIASLPGMYERTIPLYTLSKSYAMTGLRLGYVAIRDRTIRERATKLLFYTASNVVSVVQFGAIGAFEGPQNCIEEFRTELRARRDLFYRGVRELPGDLFAGSPPAGAFYAFLRVDPNWERGRGSSARRPEKLRPPSLSWRTVEYLIKNGRIGCVPGVDFGPGGEGYIRFCFARDRKELTGAL
ncbi:MAG: pyridoxal phosphate-dependent aminotransferase, partial [Acidobacteria bacterium]|nr:pyridoxal phosphate-dependent aminotransferase [Acidobacteriota bacterium]